VEMIYYKVIDNMVDLIFLFDILLMFCSTFTNKKGKEVWEPREIASNYFFSRRFFMDTGSLLGSDISTAIIP